MLGINLEVTFLSGSIQVWVELVDGMGKLIEAPCSWVSPDKWDTLPAFLTSCLLDGESLSESMELAEIAFPELLGESINTLDSSLYESYQEFLEDNRSLLSSPKQVVVDGENRYDYIEKLLLDGYVNAYPKD